MKRRLSESDIRHPLGCGGYSAKCRKTQSTNVGAPHASSPPPSNPAQPLPINEEALRSFQKSNYELTGSPIHRWIEGCATSINSETMAAPPTPRSTTPNNRGRYIGKRYVRSQGSRTPSPSKKPSPQTYRTRNMYHASVFVDKLTDLPLPIDNEVRRILGINSWEDQVVAAQDGLQADARLTGLVSTYWGESRKNARECSLEGDWKSIINSLLRNLTEFWPGALQTHMSEKVWNSDLKPTASSLDEVPNEDQREIGPPRFASTQNALPTFNPNDAAATATAFSQPVPSLPPSTQSIASTTSTDAVDPYHISTPKPDITVGLAHTAFAPRHQRRLVDHQASGSILSDPHAADMGIRFPFLVVEAKGLSLNGSLVSAQNQAAVSGASMLSILKDLGHQAAGSANSGTDLRSCTQDVELTSTSSSSPSAPQSSVALCFSIVTEGPVHELWVHFENEGAYYMEFLQSWRTTIHRDARGLAHCLARIMEWGRGNFKDSIVTKLDNV